MNRRLGGAYAALAVVDAALAATGRRAARRVTKSSLMPVLQLATGGTGPRRQRLARAGVVARAASWAGDVALLGEGDRAFLSGVGSFAVAHAAYIVGFVSARDSTSGVRDRGPKVAAAVWLVLAPVMARAAGEKAPALRGPVAAYAGILASMFATSTMLDRELALAARRRIGAGTALFLLSDGLIGVKDFLLDEPSPPLEAAVMLTYTAGQWLIADGVTRATS